MIIRRQDYCFKWAWSMGVGEYIPERARLIQTWSCGSPILLDTWPLKTWYHRSGEGIKSKRT